MSYSLRKIISEAINEVLGGLRFQKVRIGLFSDSSCSYTNLDKSLYESNSNKIEYVNITPVMALNNPVIKNIFSEDELNSLDLRWYNNDGTDYDVVCAEGILRYKYYQDADCDGESSGESIDLDTKNDEDWKLIKDRIKSVLTQNDINHAIEQIGVIKNITKQQKGDKKTLEQVFSDMGVAKKQYQSYELYVLTFNNNKSGLFRIYSNKPVAIIQPIFDWIGNYNEKDKTIEAIKGEIKFKFKIEKLQGIILNKSHISERLNGLRDALLKKYRDDLGSGKLNIERLYSNLKEDFLEFVDYINQGPEREYFKSHYEGAIKYIVDNIKKITN